ncbi:MAG: hypothetical protein KAT77_03575 [Nanoarchaeota archaeon]|nr:hypothetical protein [Nanoarchaeota archaeon]
MKLGVSTGSFYKPGKWIGTQKAIKEISKLDIKNIELGFIDFERVFKFDLKQAKKDLKGFKTIGIHLPAIHYKKNKETEFVTKVMFLLYKKLKADYVVTHSGWVKNPHYLKNKKWKVLIENDTGSYKTGYKKFGNFIKKHKFNVLLDVNHASDYGLKEVNNYIKNFKNKIKVVHLAGGHKRKSIWHKSFSKATKKFLKSIESIKKLNIPIIIEDNKIGVRELKKEIKKVKEWFNV